MTKLVLAAAISILSIGSASACMDKTVTAQGATPQTVVDGSGSTLPMTPKPESKSGG